MPNDEDEIVSNPDRVVSPSEKQRSARLRLSRPPLLRIILEENYAFMHGRRAKRPEAEVAKNKGARQLILDDSSQASLSIGPLPERVERSISEAREYLGTFNSADSRLWEGTGPLSRYRGRFNNDQRVAIAKVALLILDFQEQGSSDGESTGGSIDLGREVADFFPAARREKGRRRLWSGKPTSDETFAVMAAYRLIEYIRTKQLGSLP